MRAIDVLHQGRGEGDLLLGGRRGADRPRARQSPRRRCSRRWTASEPRALLLTHIHFDHAGATGALVRRWPDLPVYVHERGAPHMVDPSRLVASAGRLYGGEEGLRALWGEMVPVPEANLRVLTRRRARRRGRVPGRVHARPRLPPRLLPPRAVRLGVRGRHRAARASRRTTFTVAPTPPPDIDVAAWERSIALDARRGSPPALGLTHFGPVEDADAQLDRCLRGAARAGRARGRARRGGLRRRDGGARQRGAGRRRGRDDPGHAAGPAPHGAGPLAEEVRRAMSPLGRRRPSRPASRVEAALDDQVVPGVEDRHLVPARVDRPPAG